MKTETVLYGIREGAEDWEEEIITSAPDTAEGKEKLEKATSWAKSKGFDRFRTAKFTPGEEPNFVKAIK